MLRQCAISFPQAQYYAFTGSEFNEAQREIGGLITLIIMRGCDLLNCKVHLNPPANYGMFWGGVSAGAVEMGLSRRAKRKSLALIKCRICDQWISSFSIIPNKLQQQQILNESCENKVVTCLLESVLSTEEGRKPNEARLTADCTCFLVCFWESF